MGYGSYTARDWEKLRSASSLHKDARVETIFTNVTALPQYDSRRVSLREARDSADSPRSTPVILGFDVTASMGYLAKELAVNAVNAAVTSLLENKPIPDPQVLCAAVGDCKSDRSPLQVTQFEADIRIIKQLTGLAIEGGGGGNNGESYNLLWYFAARHTSADCTEKRGKKGYLFTIGDDVSHPQLSPGEIAAVFNDDVPYALTNEELLREAEKTYRTFHICLETGYDTQRAVFGFWRALMPGRAAVLHKNDVGCLAELLTAIITVSEGAPLNDALNAVPPEKAERIARSMAFIDVKKDTDKKRNVITF